MRWSIINVEGVGIASPLEWRKLGITYRKNEIFFDIIEEMSFIVDV